MKKGVGWSGLLLTFCIFLSACGGQVRPRPDTKEITVFLTVTCEEAAKQGELPEGWPENGTMISQAAYSVPQGTTALELLQKAMREQKLPVELADGYVKGICSLYEGDRGTASGWLFYINGVLPSVGAGDCVLQEEDTVEWFYLCDMNMFFAENTV